MKPLIVLTALTVLAAPPAPGQGAPAELMTAARGHLAARRLDSAAVLFRQVAETPALPVADRVQAWVMLGIVDFYRSGDSAAADAFRHALALDPGFEVSALDQFEPAIARLLAAQRPATLPRTAPVAAIQDCVRKCPDGVRAPWFDYFPQLELEYAMFGPTMTRGFLLLYAVVGANGRVEPETVEMAGGTLRRLEPVMRGALLEARFHAGRADDVPVRTRVTLRFEFRAEGLNTIRYTYEVVAR